MRVGIVADAHGHLDPKLPGLFAGCDLILDAGDAVKPEVQAALRAVAPLTAVRGNNDHGPAFAALPEVALVDLGELSALVVHDLGRTPRPRGARPGAARAGAHPPLPRPPARPVLARHDPEIVIHGHSHRPGARVEDGTLFLNPGSAGPRRFSLPRTAAVLAVHGRRVLVAFFDLAGDEVRPFGDPLEADL